MIARMATVFLVCVLGLQSAYGDPLTIHELGITVEADPGWVRSLGPKSDAAVFVRAHDFVFFVAKPGASGCGPELERKRRSGGGSLMATSLFIPMSHWHDQVLVAYGTDAAGSVLRACAEGDRGVLLMDATILDRREAARTGATGPKKQDFDHALVLMFRASIAWQRGHK